MVAAIPPNTPVIPPLQRRYSISGKTPLEDLGSVKSPLQALDTNVQSPSCGLCDSSSSGGAGENAVRTSAKRSAMQLPSPNTPAPQELPTKIARLGLDQDDMDLSGGEESCVTDPLPDEREWVEDDIMNMDQDFLSISPSSTSSPADCDCECDHAISPSDSATALPTSTIPSPPLAFTPCEMDIQHPTFLTLPPEIRHQIYLHLPDLVLPHPLIYCLSTFANKKSHPLASVSSQIRAEALAIFYTYNIWTIKLEFKIMYDAFQEWICRLGDSARDLRVVIIAVRGRMFKPWTRHGRGSNLISVGNQQQQQTILPSNQATAINMALGTGSASTAAGAGPAGPMTILPSNTSMIASPLLPPVPPVTQATPHPYSPPDGDASFRIDLSEKWAGGRVELLRNDGTAASGELARFQLSKLVVGIWEKRQAGTLNGQDWVNLVDRFLALTGGGSW
ncbi:hypothetical protein BU24DRAFT_68744 [Aaosphaeria arxii CBS 175.79]|uniref:F-box domain-containing protein n=1 Tax=Aaosphaeria arxii CBS 175.79 TaxID=1450172 RepID=A0A6A5XAL7_9PLEO|nr:uncharacterized protein BU24DRAFT_68744 [Aaosphaeria arxii CBS 175.79]KAF2009981.1 hypothetical protein BU24DRAFT_68744 [Aaosphaeria arxii CBS 175.79]